VAPVLTADFEQRFPGGAEVAAAIEVAGPGITVLFGPSGAGKSTVLRVLAGLERPRRGWVRFGGETWSDAGRGVFLPPARRSVGMLFQDFALFPHLTVEENLGYGLARRPRAERRTRVKELAAWLGLEELLQRHPAALSGGQQQRLALGRALAPWPKLLLLDEPLSSLDVPTRESLRRELGRRLREAAVPAVLVTHDRDEALALGDRVALMLDGRIHQEGPPAEVFSRPADADAARILGFGTVVKARLAGHEHGLLRIRAGSAELLAPDPGGLGTTVYACIRGEGVALEREDPAHAATRNRLRATVAALEPAGALVRVHLDAGFPLQALLTAWACEDLGLRPGDSLHALVKATAVHLVPAPE
jgi:molybdate transport system ATP-binding protein